MFSISYTCTYTLCVLASGLHTGMHIHMTHVIVRLHQVYFHSEIRSLRCMLVHQVHFHSETINLVPVLASPVKPCFKQGDQLQEDDITCL